MVIKVGINGFGRIGRVIFRTCLQNPDIELSAVNDPAIDIDYICYLIKFDSTHGKFKGNVTHTEYEINIDGRIIKVFRDKLPHTVPWQVAGVQYVIEASGMFTCLEKSSGHLASDGVKRVIVTAPSADIPMIILGVNDNKLNAEQKIMSCGSSTLYCLAPIVKVLEDNYGVTEGFITSIHAMTPSLKPLDGLCLRGKHWRDHRSIHQNIIPATTGSCKALAKIIPQVKDKMTGLAFRVPIVNVSVLDMTVRLDNHTNLQDIIKTVERASKSFLQNIIKISNEEAVSSDFSGDSHSCILDADSSLQLRPDFFKIICWYENEYSYACRVLDSIFFSERQFNKPVRLPCKMTYVRAKITKKQDKLQQTERSAKEMPPLECNAEVTKSCTSAQETTCKRKSPVRPMVLRKPLSSHSPGTPATAPAVNRDAKKRNDLFKIWNDNNDAQKDAAKQNRTTYFQSCMAFGPKQIENTDCMKAQERLENVKREFSKMVNITEDLLKKSNADKLQLGPATKSSLEGVKLVANGGSKDSKTVIKLNNPQANNAIFDICGDYKNKLSTSPTDGNSEEVRCSSPSDRKEKNTEYNIASAVKQIVTNNKPSCDKITCFAKQMTATYFGQMAAVQNSLPAKENDSLKKSTFMNSVMNSASPTDSNSEEVRCSSPSDRKENNTEYNISSAVKQIVTNNKPSCEKITCFAKQMTATYFGQMAAVQNSLPAKENDSLKNSTFMNSAMHIKGHMTKTGNYFMESSNESPVQCAMKEQKEIPPKISDNVVKELVKKEQIQVKITEGSISPQAPTERKESNIQESDRTETIHDKDLNKYLHKQDYNMRVIDGELQKRNILLVNNQKQNNSEVNFKSCNMSIQYREQLVKETETRSKNFNKQILESLSMKFLGPVVMVPEESSGCCSPGGTATTISNGNDTRNKPDLYDKLDSASATNSTNSFEINERKSQVLQICDLTNSLEDLGRLDKICRIIEISDELSDKLFSSLDQPELMGLHEKKWSFRDLCERIQLDDFCNNVFGKSRI